MIFKGSYKIWVDGVLVAEIDNLITQKGREQIMKGVPVTSRQLLLSSDTGTPTKTDDAVSELSTLAFQSQENKGEESIGTNELIYTSKMKFSGQASGTVSKVAVKLNDFLFSVALLDTPIEVEGQVTAEYTLTMRVDVTPIYKEDVALSVRHQFVPEGFDMFDSLDAHYMQVGVVEDNKVYCSYTEPWASSDIYQVFKTNRGTLILEDQGPSDGTPANYYAYFIMVYDFGDD